MKTKALTAAALIACFTALSPAMAQTASPQGATATSGGSTMSGKAHRTGKSGMGNKAGTKGSPVVNEKSSATDASSTATQGGGASPLTTGEGMKQPSTTAR